MLLEYRPNFIPSAKRLSARLHRGETLLLDGATGSQLEREGIAVPPPLWSASALLDHPDRVCDIHTKYVAVGVDIVTANTFRTSRYTLRKAGFHAEKAIELDRLAVKLARAATSTVDREIVVAGSIAPLEDCYKPELTPPFDVAFAEHCNHAHSLAAAGVDCILIETMPTIRETEAALMAANETGLDVMISVVCRDKNHLLSGDSIQTLVQQLSRYPLAAILINCSPPNIIQGALEQLGNLTDLPRGGYANIDIADSSVGWKSDPPMTPQRYAMFAAGWYATGAQIIGGCCGTTPSHIAALRTMLDNARSPHNDDRSFA